MDADSLDMLLRLRDHAHRGEALPAAVAAWIIEGIKAHLEHGVPLDLALGLRLGRGERTPRTRLCIGKRNALVRQAWEMVEGKTPWLKCKALAEKITAFETRIWPRVRNTKLPGHYDAVETLIDAAFQRGIGMPRSPGQIRNIVQPNQ